MPELDDLMAAAPDTAEAASGLETTLTEFQAEEEAETDPNDFLGQFDEDSIREGEEEKPTAEGEEQEGEEEKPTVEGEEKEEEEEDDIDKIQEPEKASQAAKDNFNKIKASAKEYKAKAEAAEKRYNDDIATRDTELAKLREIATKLPEFEEKAQFAEEAERELAISRVEGTREYRNTIDAPLKAIEDRAESISKTNEIDFDTVLDALTERDWTKRTEMLNDLVGNLLPTDQVDLITMAKDTQALLTKRDEIHNRSAEARKELEERTLADQTQAQKVARDSFQKAADQAVAGLKERLPFLELNAGETADSVYEAMQAKVREVDFESASPAQKAFAATASIALVRMNKQFAELMKANKKLEARISEKNSSSPAVGGEQTTESPNKEGDFMDDVFDYLGVKQNKTVFE